MGNSRRPREFAGHKKQAPHVCGHREEPFPEIRMGALDFEP
jgi:hypothetical protein